MQKGKCEKNKEVYFFLNSTQSLNIPSVSINVTQNLTIGFWVRIIGLIKTSNQKETLIDFPPFSFSFSSELLLALTHKELTLITHDYSTYNGKWNFIYLSLNMNSLSLTINKLNTKSIDINFDRNSIINNVLFGNRIIYFIQNLIITKQVFKDSGEYINSFLSKYILFYE
jgi:hypothetical protein